MLLALICSGLNAEPKTSETPNYVFEFLKPLQERSPNTQLTHYVRVEDERNAVATAEKIVENSKLAGVGRLDAELKLLETKIHFLGEKPDGNALDEKERLYRDFLKRDFLPPNSVHRANILLGLAHFCYQNNSLSSEDLLEIQMQLDEADSILVNLKESSLRIEIENLSQRIRLDKAKLDGDIDQLQRLIASLIAGVNSEAKHKDIWRYQEIVILIRAHMILHDLTSSRHHLDEAVRLMNEEILLPVSGIEFVAYVDHGDNLRKERLLLGLVGSEETPIEKVVEKFNSNSLHSYLLMAIPEMGERLQTDLTSVLRTSKQ